MVAGTAVAAKMELIPDGVLGVTMLTTISLLSHSTLYYMN